MVRGCAARPGGIIPAYAGSTTMDGKARQMRTGSSPHTRGARTTRSLCGVLSRDHPRIRGEHSTPCAAHQRCLGIIPAYAGSTGTVPSRELAERGSSPHTRGARSARPAGTRQSRDHPRIRGEHASSRPLPYADPGIIPAYAGSTAGHNNWAVPAPGSSPHTRGAQTTAPGCCEKAGDHPRIRGEHRA